MDYKYVRDREDLTKEQRDALDQLESAFQQCHLHGLNFIGMDATLLCFTESDLKRVNFFQAHDPTYALRKIDPLNPGIEVDDHGTYLESGGW